MTMSNNILIFGCDFFPTRKTSEINFWNDMVEMLAGHFEQVVILSVNHREVDEEKLADNVWLYNVRPHYFGKGTSHKDPEYSGSKFQKMPFSIVYKTYSFLQYLPVFDRLIKKHDIGIIHYMRVFGLLNSKLTRKYPQLYFSITVPTHVDRGFPLHGIYHVIKNMALKPMDKIIATSDATRDRLEHLGIKRDLLEVIHWTISDHEKPVLQEGIDRIKAKYKIGDGSKVILWAGPLQDTGAAEFYFALEVAKKVVSQSKYFTFVFAFKPDKLKPEYGQAAKNVDNVYVIETGRNEFLGLRSLADLFLSPVCNKNRTLAPPLTWIEMMRLGKPVITTNVSGVNEIIIHGEDGFVIDTVEGIVTLLIGLNEAEIHRAGEKASKAINDRYRLDGILSRYIALWQAGMGHKNK